MPCVGMEDCKAWPTGETQGGDIAPEKAALIQARCREVTILETSFPWCGRPFSKVVTTEVPLEAASLQVGCVPAEALQLLLDDERAVDEACLGNDQVTRGHTEDERAIAECQVRPKEADDAGAPFELFVIDLRVVEVDLRHVFLSLGLERDHAEKSVRKPSAMEFHVRVGSREHLVANPR